MILFILSLFLGFAKGPESPFDLGKKSYESGRYLRAIEYFGGAISSGLSPDMKNVAYYYQGLSFYELGLNYSSYTAFQNALLSGNANQNLIEKTIQQGVAVSDKLDLIEKFGKLLLRIPKNQIPAKVMGSADYAIGASLVLSNEFSKAEPYLKAVPPENPFFAKSQFFLGIVATKNRNYKDAIFYFRKTAQLATGNRDLQDLGELARLNLARNVYSSGAIEKSIAYYSQFLNTSPYWISILQEASWPLLRVNDTTVSLGNLHTVLSPFFREDLVGEAYVLRATILFSLCKYEEMRKTLTQFFAIYDPIITQMENEKRSLAGGAAYYQAFTDKKITPAFMNFIKRDQGIQRKLQVLSALELERMRLARVSKSDTMRGFVESIDKMQETMKGEIGVSLQRIHHKKLAELFEQREQANYFKVEIVTGEKEMVEGQKGLPPRRVADVETTVAPSYRYWPFQGEYWQDELGAYVYTVESSCLN